jgi:hypothetical protein
MRARQYPICCTICVQCTQTLVPFHILLIGHFYARIPDSATYNWYISHKMKKKRAEGLANDIVQNVAIFCYIIFQTKCLPKS